MEPNFDIGPKKLEGDVAEFVRLKNEYKNDEKAVNSKYSKDFFLRIESECQVLIYKGNNNINNPEVRDRMHKFAVYVQKIKSQEPFSITENEVGNAEKFLNFMIKELQK